MPKLFEPIKIHNLELKNRAMRSATWDGAADAEGKATDKAVELFRGLGRGQIGLIVTGHAYVSRMGQGSPLQYGIYNHAMIPGLKRLTDAVHGEGSKIAVQISHCGINSGFFRRQGIVCQAVSEMEGFETPHKAMTGAEIDAIIADFVAASRRAVKAGFDAIQLHGAHGFLMSEFLSPFFNRRTDKWGGSTENRRRFSLEVIRQVRGAIGKDFPLLMKFGPWEEIEGGLVLEDGIEAARSYVRQGLDAIEVSIGAAGGARAEAAGSPEKVYFRKQAAAVKKAVSVPVAVVNGIRTLATANKIIESGDADMISMSRPFIRQPDLLLHWQREEAATCISCNKCFPSGDRILSCGEDRRIREEKGKGK